jgi:hypothetical protein
MDHDERRDENDEADGSLQKDEPEIGKGTGEGERGLGEQSGATGGEHETEGEDEAPERMQDRG